MVPMYYNKCSFKSNEFPILKQLYRSIETRVGKYYDRKR
jgi:hypothetical protein